MKIERGEIIEAMGRAVGFSLRESGEEICSPMDHCIDEFP